MYLYNILVLDYFLYYTMKIKRVSTTVFLSKINILIDYTYYILIFQTRTKFNKLLRKQIN